ncbi:MAG: DUF3667 domain-containing protein [Prevotella sp.]|nr:DUF3667 domain-containing protein [Prevotella sp.]
MRKRNPFCKYRRFRVWQENPFQYAMNEEETHRCCNCGHEYVGNFCPQCGQKATLGEVNWSSVRENVMEIWGMGTRSMTYTLWQLLWRPGYLIRDYISGKRQVSFPPVKMLLIVAIVCMLIANLLGNSSEETQSVEGMDAVITFLDWAERNQGWGYLIIYSTMILPTWVLFHHSPRCTAHKLPQGFFIQVFLSTLALIFVTLAECFMPIYALIPLYFFITYYQLFGYGLWGTLWRTLLCSVTAAFIVLMIVILIVDMTEKQTAEHPAWLVKSITVAVLSLCCAAILAVGYAIGRWSQKRRNNK